jgi:hypothetical protein
MLSGFTGNRVMPGVIISIDELGTAPPVARLWLERKFTWMFRQRQVSVPSSAEPDGSPRGDEQRPMQGIGDVSRSDYRAVTPSPETEGAIPSEAPISARTSDLNKLIAERAYEIWENEGRPHGYDLIHWKTAEQEIMDAVKRA